MKNRILAFSSPERWEEEDNIDFAFYDVNEYQNEYTDLVDENLNLKILITNLLKRIRFILKSHNLKDDISKIMFEYEQKIAYYQKHYGDQNGHLFSFSNASTQTYEIDDTKKYSSFNPNHSLNENPQNSIFETENSKIHETKPQSFKSTTNKSFQQSDRFISFLTSQDIDYEQEIEILRNQLKEQIDQNDILRNELKNKEKQKTAYSLSCKKLIHELTKTTINDMIVLDLTGLDTNKTPIEIEKCVDTIIQMQRDKNEEILDSFSTDKVPSMKHESSSTKIKQNEIYEPPKHLLGYQTFQLYKIVNNTIRTYSDEMKRQFHDILKEIDEIKQ